MTEPTLGQYPGLPLAAKKPFLSRAKVGTATGLLGLLLGAGIGASGQPAISADMPEVKSLVSKGVEEKTAAFADEKSELSEESDQLRVDLEKAQQEAVDAAAAADRQVANAKSAALKAQKLAVKEAVAAEQAKQAASSATRGFASTGSGSGSAGTSSSSDPLFGTCGEANDHGYGPYQQGVDSEYSNYQDRDGDGLVCEY
jgi:hypothetical protein